VTGAPGALIVQSTPACPPVVDPQVGRGGATQSTPGTPLIPCLEWVPLQSQTGSGDTQPFPGTPFVPFPLQIGALLLVQLVSGTSESAPMHVGRTPRGVLI